MASVVAELEGYIRETQASGGQQVTVLKQVTCASLYEESLSSLELRNTRRWTRCLECSAPCQHSMTVTSLSSSYHALLRLKCWMTSCMRWPAIRAAVQWSTGTVFCAGLPAEEEQRDPQGMEAPLLRARLARHAVLLQQQGTRPRMLHAVLLTRHLSAYMLDSAFAHIKAEWSVVL